MSHFNSSSACTDRSFASTLVIGVPILRAASSQFQFVAGGETGLARRILAAAALASADGERSSDTSDSRFVRAGAIFAAASLGSWEGDSRSDLGDAQRTPTEWRNTNPTSNRVITMRDAAQRNADRRAVNDARNEARAPSARRLPQELALRSLILVGVAQMQRRVNDVTRHERYVRCHCERHQGIITRVALMIGV